MKKRVLFVCLGNICRSPSAEAVFNQFIRKRNLTGEYEVDSAGISDWHKGEPADPRMKFHAKKRDIHLSSLSRPVIAKDFDYFDYIIAMDHDNLKDLKEMAPKKEHRKKIFLITDFSQHPQYPGIPDPYYSGVDGFELVLDLLEDAMPGFLAFLQNNHRE